MFDNDPFDQHLQETRQMVGVAQRKFWTALKWIGAAMFVLALAALFVAWAIWGR